MDFNVVKILSVPFNKVCSPGSFLVPAPLFLFFESGFALNNTPPALCYKSIVYPYYISVYSGENMLIYFKFHCLKGDDIHDLRVKTDYIILLFSAPFLESRSPSIQKARHEKSVTEIDIILFSKFYQTGQTQFLLSFPLTHDIYNANSLTSSSCLMVHFTNGKKYQKN